LRSNLAIIIIAVTITFTQVDYHLIDLVPIFTQTARHSSHEFFILGPEDSTVVNYAPDGNFIQHRQSVTLVVRAGQYQVPLLCWVLLIVLLLSIVVSLVIICCVCFKSKSIGRPKKRASRVASHINGFSPANAAQTHLEMLPKYCVSTPAQSYSTQKLYQWCQQKEMQQYKSLWAVNPTSGEEEHWLKFLESL
jgi:hypothetical protein